MTGDGIPYETGSDEEPAPHCQKRISRPVVVRFLLTPRSCMRKEAAVS